MHRDREKIGDDEVLDFPAMAEAENAVQDLRAHYLFAGLDQSDFDAIAKRVSAVRLDKGNVLFHHGDRAEHFFYVASGHVELNLIAPTGQKKVLEVVGPERTFGEAIAFMQESKYPVTAEALDDSELLRIPIRDYVHMLYGNPDACMRLLSDVCRHLHLRVQEIERLTVQNARDRLVSYLLEHIVERDEDEATIRIDLPRHVIASRLSITPETLSRLLRNLADERIVTVEDRIIYVHSLERLRPYS